jgi:hypothetical protein
MLYTKKIFPKEMTNFEITRIIIYIIIQFNILDISIYEIVKALLQKIAC